MQIDNRQIWLTTENNLKINTMHKKLKIKILDFEWERTVISESWEANEINPTVFIRNSQEEFPEHGKE